MKPPASFVPAFSFDPAAMATPLRRPVQARRLPSSRPHAAWPGVVMACLVALSGMAGCAPQGGGPVEQSSETRADAATWEACRRRANEIFERQNRGTIFAANSGLNSPMSGSFGPGQTDRGLADMFTFDQRVRDCVRNAGTGAERNATTPPSQTPPPPPPPPGRPPASQR